MQLLLSTSNSKFFSKVVSAKKRTVSRPLFLPRIHSAPAFMLTAAPSPVPAPASPVMPSSSQRAPSAY